MTHGYLARARARVCVCVQSDTRLSATRFIMKNAWLSLRLATSFMEVCGTRSRFSFYTSSSGTRTREYLCARVQVVCLYPRRRHALIGIMAREYRTARVNARRARRKDRLYVARNI